MTYSLLLLSVVVAVAPIAQSCAPNAGPARTDASEELNMNAKKDIVVIAHRGVHTDRPESTIPAVERAIELGLDYVEIDMRQTEDGRYVMMHNGTVDATTNGSGTVSEMTSDEIRALDAGANYAPEWSGLKVPFVEEVLAIMSGRIGAYVDVKNAPAAAVVNLLQQYDMAARSVIYAGPDEQIEMKSLDPDIRPMPEYPGDPDMVAELVARTGSSTIAISSWDECTPEAVAACHAAGAEVFVDMMREDTPKGVAYAIECGVDGIQTDQPEIVLAELRRLGRHQCNPNVKKNSG